MPHIGLRRRSLPLSRRYDWVSIAALVLVLALGIAAFVLGAVGEVNISYSASMRATVLR